MARVQKIDDSIGKRLRAVRRSVGDTAEDLAKTAGVTRSYIGQIEHGRIRNPDQNGVIKRISERWAHLGISYEWLLTGQGEPPNLPRPHIKPGDVPSYWRPIISEWHADERTNWEMDSARPRLAEYASNHDCVQGPSRSRHRNQAQ